MRARFAFVFLCLVTLMSLGRVRGEMSGSADYWRAIPSGPLSPRIPGVSVWTGRELIVWGGSFKTERFNGPYVSLGDGARFDPVRKEWRVISTNGAPSPRESCVSTWTGRELIVYGGVTAARTDPPASIPYSIIRNNGAIYNPATDQWRPMSVTNVSASLAVWTGTEVLFWGATPTGFGVRYNPETDTWSDLSSQPPVENGIQVKAIWTGKEFIWWDSSGRWGRYSPAEDRWRTNAFQDLGGNSPMARTGVWSGSEAVFWIEGATPPLWKYDPERDHWEKSHSTVGSYASLLGVTMVWSGRELMIWQGTSTTKGFVMMGGRYDPVTDNYRPTATDEIAAGRGSSAAVWTGSEVLLWGGFDGWHRGYLTDGVTYVPELPRLNSEGGGVSGGQVSWPYPFADFRLESVGELGTNLFLPAQVQAEVKGTNWELNLSGNSNLFLRLQRMP